VAPLDEIARLLGFPGKLGMAGNKVWAAYQTGSIDTIRCYCETDAANTYLVFLRFQLMRGMLNQEQYEQELNLVHSSLTRSTAAHWKEFIGAWEYSPPQPCEQPATSH
jgi:predicted PolB exonuclease-like 3'-5' exonuclease